MEWFLVDGNCGFVDGNSTTEPSHRTTQNKEEAIYTRKSDTRLKPSASMPHKLIQRRDPDVIVLQNSCPKSGLQIRFGQA
jgi:hypothetical protein